LISRTDCKGSKGTRDTLKDTPGRIEAYNNGIVIFADEMILGKRAVLESALLDA